jgi:hypothetical protein
MADLQPAIGLCEWLAARTDDCSDREAGRYAAAVLRKVNALDPHVRDELLARLDRIDALELLGLKSAILHRPNWSVTMVDRHVTPAWAGQARRLECSTMGHPFRPLHLAADPRTNGGYMIDQVATGSGEVLLQGPITARMFPPVAPDDERPWPYENIRTNYVMQPGESLWIEARATVDGPPTTMTIWGVRYDHGR